jgi:hypothetical protein
MVVGMDGNICRTTDGGNSWILQNSGTTSYLTDVAVLDSSNAIILISNSSKILRTTDGGDSWKEQLLTYSSPIERLSFINSKIGIGIGAYVNRYINLFRTTDGGSSWEVQRLYNIFVSGEVKFLDSNRMVSLAGNGASLLMFSSNGGVNWNIQTLPQANWNDIAFLTNGQLVLMGYHWSPDSVQFIISTMAHDLCSPKVEIQKPWDNETDIVIPEFGRELPLLQWSFTQNPIAPYSTVQISNDSIFQDGIILDSNIAFKSFTDTLSLEYPFLKPLSTYYWRVAIEHFDGTRSDWSVIRKFTTAGGNLNGIVYDDRNRDCQVDTGDKRLKNWPLSLSGIYKNTIIYTDTLGEFNIAGIDSGTYNISDNISTFWGKTCPDSSFYKIYLNRNEEIQELNFGRYYPWNTISGKLFHDQNENGIYDTAEIPLSNWKVIVASLSNPDIELFSTTSDSSGLYAFNYMNHGDYILKILPDTLWEQIYPKLNKSYEIYFQDYNNHYTNCNFAVHRIPPRVKIPIFVRSTVMEVNLKAWFGVRQGATYGIWGVDSACSFFDNGEGEEEYPPILTGMYDARFVDPRGGSRKFGLGSVVDMRDYISSSQIDTFKLTFIPGYNQGGTYPMMLYWSKDSIIKSFSGSVLLSNPALGTFDMKIIDSLEIIDSTISSVNIVAQSPKLTLLAAEVMNGVPSAFNLYQNYPNPFNPITNIKFSIARSQLTILSVYDILGREVKTLVKEIKQPGVYTVQWDASKIPSGIYFYRLNVGEFIETKKLLLIR